MKKTLLQQSLPNFQCFKVCWKPFKSPLSVHKWKCFSEASLFNFNYLYINHHLLARKFMVDLAVITAWTHSGSVLWRISLGLRKKIKMSFASLGQSVLGKTVPSVLGTVFPNTDLPVGEYYICTACYIWI